MGIPRRPVMVTFAVVAVLGAGTLATVPAGAASALPVSLSGGGGEGGGTGVAYYNSAGNIVLNPGSYGSSSMNVDLASLGDTSVPQTPPSFATDNYADQSPEWAIRVSDGTNPAATLLGYPAQLGGTANGTFTGGQWAVNSNTGSYETYQQAVAQACPVLSACQVTAASITDGTPSNGNPSAATLTNVQYDGESPAPGTAVTVSPVAAQTLTAVRASTPVQVKATTTTGGPHGLTYSDNGTLPPGLAIDPTTGVIGGAPAAAAVGSRTATITVTDAAGNSVSTKISYTVKKAPASGVCSASTGCAWQRLTNPSSMVMDVKGQTPSTGKPVIAYTPTLGDPAVDFTAVPSGFGTSEQLKYTPYGTRATAEARNSTLAAGAYNANGSAKYCVSSVADTAGQALQLRPCATTANEWQDFVHGGDAPGGSMIEPTYATPGVSAWAGYYGPDPMAINDKGYGGNGSPLINYYDFGTGNELFTPGV